MRIAIAGASGFVGSALVRALEPTHDVIALARSVDGRASSESLSWRACDLFDLSAAERALEGAEVAVYLVHSMMPAAGLTQGRFDDLDLICADNFARAAASRGVRHIVYLGGLLPAEGGARSRHLESRHEVERTLGAYGVPLTTLRAGLVVGAGGSSFGMLARLVERLPVMIAPRWARSRTQPIALDDVVRLLCFAIERRDLAGRAYDVAGPDVVSYADLLRLTGEAMGRRTRVLTVPVHTLSLSLLWVSVLTGASQALVRPLVESLRHDMLPTDGLALQREAGWPATPLREAIEGALRAESASPPRARSTKARHRRAADRRVCSVQRLAVSSTRSAASVAAEYMLWLPRFFRPILSVTVEAGRVCRFFLRPLSRPLLVLELDAHRSGDDRQLFRVVGGLLAGGARGGEPRLEMREVLGGSFVLAALHDFVPRLPWLIYRATQARAHVFVMRAFARHLAKELAS